MFFFRTGMPVTNGYGNRGALRRARWRVPNGERSEQARGDEEASERATSAAAM